MLEEVQKALWNTSVQNWLAIATLIVTVLSSRALYKRAKRDNIESKFNEKLFHLQNLAFNNTFLEEKKFTKNWKILRYRCIEDTPSEDENDKCQKYDTYCEMVFNFASEVYHYYKNEEKMLGYIAFKPWLRPHAQWWKDPLDAHSNRETYSSDFCDLVDKWMK